MRENIHTGIFRLHGDFNMIRRGLLGLNENKL